MNFFRLDTIVRLIIMICIVTITVIVWHGSGRGDQARAHAPSARLPAVFANEQVGGQLVQIPSTDYLSIPGGIDTGAGAITAGDVGGVRGSFSGDLTTAGSFTVANGTARSQKASTAAAPSSVSHGSLSADASNFMGVISGIGSNSSVVLTFSGGGFVSYAHCFVQALGGTYVGEGYAITPFPSLTAPTFACKSSSAAGGAAANCPDLLYQCWGK